VRSDETSVSTAYRNIVIAICFTATSILLEDASSATSQATDHFDGQRFHNRERFPTLPSGEEADMAGR